MTDELKAKHDAFKKDLAALLLKHEATIDLQDTYHGWYNHTTHMDVTVGPCDYEGFSLGTYVDYDYGDELCETTTEKSSEPTEVSPEANS